MEPVKIKRNSWMLKVNVLNPPSNTCDLFWKLAFSIIIGWPAMIVISLGVFAVSMSLPIVMLVQYGVLESGEWIGAFIPGALVTIALLLFHLVNIIARNIVSTVKIKQYTATDLAKDTLKNKLCRRIEVVYED